MANTTSAKKALRASERKREVNISRKSRIRTFIRKVADSIKASDKEKALADLKNLESEIMSGVSKNIMHINTASRKLSRLHAQIKKIGSK